METSALRDALSQVRSRIAKFSGSRQQNEENTKATLIEPVLRALGWDVEDLEEVQREYKRRPRDKPVDYALLVMRTPRLFIEAKTLGQNLDDHRWASQIMGYATVAGVEWVVLTDGNEYRLYNAHASVPVEEKLFRSVRVTDEGTPAAETLELLSKNRMQENRIEVLWKAHFVDKRVHAAVTEIIGVDPDPGIVRLIRARATDLSPAEIRASLSRAELKLDFPVKPEPLMKKPKPAKRGDPRPGNGGTDVSLADLIQSGLIHPPLELVKKYKGHELAAQVTADGQVVFQGKVYDSLSTAAGMARASVVGLRGGKCPPTNGWAFWKFKAGDGALKEVDCLRQGFSKQKR